MPRAKKVKVDRSKKHVVVKLFYQRTHELEFSTMMEAKRWLEARALTRQSHHYAEVWEMSNEYDGEQEGIYENSSSYWKLDYINKPSEATHQAWRKAAQEEVEFLKSLLPPDMQQATKQ